MRPLARLLWLTVCSEQAYNRENNGDESTMSTVPERFIIDSKGRRTGVVLTLRRYRKLMEDLHDLAVVAERRSEPTISFEEMKRRLKKNGLL